MTLKELAKECGFKFYRTPKASGQALLTAVFTPEQWDKLEAAIKEKQDETTTN